MEKTFHFDSPQEVYRADACVISCFDARFDLVLRKLLKRLAVLTYDRVAIPGSAKALAFPDNDAVRDFVLGMIRTSMRLHGPTRLLLTGHNDCGAYPGAPPEAVANDLMSAAGVIRAAEPSMSIECYFLDFDGAYRVT